MKLVIDAQLPYVLKDWLTSRNEDVVQTMDLPVANLTDDYYIINLSMEEQRVVISKDKDFYEYYLVTGKPYKLLWLTTGNIKNRQLLDIFRLNFDRIKFLFETKQVIEVGLENITTHH